MRIYNIPLTCYRVKNYAVNSPLLIHLRETEEQVGKFTVKEVSIGISEERKEGWRKVGGLFSPWGTI
jgi:hypothetical protein